MWTTFYSLTAVGFRASIVYGDHNIVNDGLWEVQQQRVEIDGALTNAN